MMKTDAISSCDTFSRPKEKRMNMVMTGVNALSIWMKDTVRYRYARLPRYSVRAINRPMGTMLVK